MLKPFCFYPNKKKAIVELSLWAVPLVALLYMDAIIVSAVCSNYTGFAFLLILVVLTLAFLIPIVRKILILISRKPLLLVSDEGLVVDYLFYRVTYPLQDISDIVVVDISLLRFPLIAVKTTNYEICHITRRFILTPIEKEPEYTMGNIDMGLYNVSCSRQYNMIMQYLCEYRVRQRDHQKQTDGEYVNALDVDNKYLAEDIKISEALNKYERRAKIVEKSFFTVVVFFLAIVVVSVAHRERVMKDWEHDKSEWLDSAIVNEDSTVLCRYAQDDSLRAFMPLVRLQRHNKNLATTTINKAINLAKSKGIDTTEFVALKKELLSENDDISSEVQSYFKYAERGDVMCMHNLGVCYEKGIGVSKNLDEAIKWYRMAIENGLFSTQEDLDRVQLAKKKHR